MAQNPTTRRVDIVVAVRDEQDNVRRFVDRVMALEMPPGVELGIIFIEDSSVDHTLTRLRELVGESDRVHYFSLEQGYGQGPALVFGMAQSAADAVVTIDADGSHPPELLVPIVSAHLAGAEIVQAHRVRTERRRWYRAAGAALVERLGQLLTGVVLADQNVHFRLVSARVRDRILANPRWWVFLRLRAAPGEAERWAQIPFVAPAREHGQSKYGPLRLARLSVDGVLSLMPTSRYLAMLGALAGVGLLGAWEGSLAIALAGAGLTGGLVAARAMLPRADLLERMNVRESG